MQVPDWQLSACVQALPSSQAAPFGLAGWEHPVAELQVPAIWHWSTAVHVTGFVPRQVPAWQVSVAVQGLSSLQVVPLGLFGEAEQTPVVLLHVPAT